MIGDDRCKYLHIYICIFGFGVIGDDRSAKICLMMIKTMGLRSVHGFLQNIQIPDKSCKVHVPTENAKE